MPLSISSLGLGAFSALCAPGFGCWWIAWIGLIPAFTWLLSCPSPKTAGIHGWLFGIGFHAVYLSWLLSLHPMDWLGFPTVESLFLAICTWLVASISGGLAFGILAIALVFYLKATRSLRWARYWHWLTIPALWLIIFHCYQINALWFPWALLGYTQTNLPILNDLISISGSSSSITALLVSANLLSAQFIRRAPQTKRLFFVLGIPALLTVLYYLPSFRVPSHLSPPLPITLYQGGVDIGTIKTGQDFAASSQEAYLTPLKRMSFQVNSLLVLPEEGIVPGWVNQDRPLDNPALLSLQLMANEKRIAILSGISSFKPAGTAPPPVFNSTVLLQPNQPARFYNKIQLVPFGESVPYLGNDFANSALETFKIPYQFNFRAGTKPTPFTVNPNPAKQQPPIKVGSLICFELLYPELARQYRKAGANLLTNSSNLGWFHQSKVLSRQFLAIGQARALETGLPLVIASNNGPSAFITPDGKIIQMLSKPLKASLNWRIQPTGQ